MKSVKLSVPLQFGSETIHELEFQEPKAKDLDGFNLQDLANASVVRKLISRLSGVPDKVIGEMSASDFIVAMNEVYDFLPDFQETMGSGKESSPTSSSFSLQS